MRRRRTPRRRFYPHHRIQSNPRTPQRIRHARPQGAACPSENLPRRSRRNRQRMRGALHQPQQNRARRHLRRRHPHRRRIRTHHPRTHRQPDSTATPRRLTPLQLVLPHLRVPTRRIPRKSKHYTRRRQQPRQPSSAPHHARIKSDRPARTPHRATPR